MGGLVSIFESRDLSPNGAVMLLLNQPTNRPPGSLFPGSTSLQSAASPMCMKCPYFVRQRKALYRILQDPPLGALLRCTPMYKCTGSPRCSRYE